MGFRSIFRLASRARCTRLAMLGLVLGAAAGALYTIQSLSHMIVEHTFDKLIVGLLLTLIGAIIGWLAGTMAVLPLRRTDRESSQETEASDPVNAPTA